MSEDTTKNGRRMPWLRKLLIVVIVLGLILSGSAYGGWKYFFGQEGEAIQSQPIEYEPTQKDKDWKKCQFWFGRAERALKRTRDIEGTIHKQEYIDGRIEPVTTLTFKARKQPKSVYLKWEEPFNGREVIFQLRQRRNRLIAHEGGALRHISPDVIMALDHPLAMKFSRHKVDEFSLQYLVKEIPTYLADAEGVDDIEIAIDEDQELRGKKCVHIRFRYTNPKEGPSDYRRFDLYISYENEFMPLRWETYGDPVDGEDQLMEYFELIDFQRNPGLEDIDFDPANESYGFRPDWVHEL